MLAPQSVPGDPGVCPPASALTFPSPENRCGTQIASTSNIIAMSEEGSGGRAQSPSFGT